MCEYSKLKYFIIIKKRFLEKNKKKEKFFPISFNKEMKSLIIFYFRTFDSIFSDKIEVKKFRYKEKH